MGTIIHATFTIVFPSDTTKASTARRQLEEEKNTLGRDFARCEARLEALTQQLKDREETMSKTGHSFIFILSIHPINTLCHPHSQHTLVIYILTHTLTTIYSIKLLSLSPLNPSSTTHPHNLSCHPSTYSTVHS